MQNPDRPILCIEHGASVPPSDYDYKAAMCQLCAKKVADLYGISRADVSFVNTVKMNLTGYFSGIPGSSKLDPRTMVRILLIYLGIPVTSPTEQENGGAEYLQKRKGGQ